jgi:hypothetical protein
MGHNSMKNRKNYYYSVSGIHTLYIATNAIGYGPMQEKNKRRCF